VRTASPRWVAARIELIGRPTRGGKVAEFRALSRGKNLVLGIASVEK